VDRALRAAGYTTWWDDNLIPAEQWNQTIVSEITAASAVLVIWTFNSVASDFVRDEAETGRKAKKLVPVRFEDVEPPLGQGAIHLADLRGWQGSADDQRWQQVLTAIQYVIDGAGMTKAAGFGGAFERRLLDVPPFSLPAVPAPSDRDSWACEFEYRSRARHEKVFGVSTLQQPYNERWVAFVATYGRPMGYQGNRPNPFSKICLTNGQTNYEYDHEFNAVTSIFVSDYKLVPDCLISTRENILHVQAGALNHWDRFWDLRGNKSDKNILFTDESDLVIHANREVGHPVIVCSASSPRPVRIYEGRNLAWRLETGPSWYGGLARGVICHRSADSRTCLLNGVTVRNVRNRPIGPSYLLWKMVEGWATKYLDTPSGSYMTLHPS